MSILINDLMNRKLKEYFIFVWLFFFFFSSLWAENTLEGLYRKGVIKLTPESGFGKSEWDSLFYSLNCYVAVGKKKIFVSNLREHKIAMFDSNGKFLKWFGMKGQGPGDLTRPGYMSILDNKYLVVSEISLRRFSVFNMEGEFVKILKTGPMCAVPVALKGGKIAYYSRTMGNYAKTGCITFNVFIKDFKTNKDVRILTKDLLLKNRIKFSNNRSSSYKIMTGEVCYNATPEGNLLLGVSNSTEMLLFSNTGKLIKKFNIREVKNRVTSDYIEAFRDEKIKACIELGYAESRIKSMRKANFEKMFDEYFPLYESFKIDGDGNILFLQWNSNYKDKRQYIDVYSPDGKFICKTEILSDYDGNFSDYHFMKDRIICLVKDKGDDDAFPKLIAVPTN